MEATLTGGPCGGQVVDATNWSQGAVKQFGDGTNNYELQGSVAIYLGDSVTGTILPPIIEEPGVITVSMVQARIALTQTPDPTGKLANMLEVVNAYVTANQAANPTLGIAWEYAAEISSDNVLVNGLFTSLGLPNSAIVSVFTLAKSVIL